MEKDLEQPNVMEYNPEEDLSYERIRGKVRLKEVESEFNSKGE